METPIIAGLVTGTAAIVSPVTAYFVKSLFETRNWTKLRGRRKAVIGIWDGTISQETVGTPMLINIRMQFTAGGRKVKGNCQLTSPVNNRYMKLDFIGGFYHADFMKFDYLNHDNSVVQFGSAVLFLSPDGRNLTGRFAGYGSTTNSIVSGEVDLNKLS
jgi:hypothetical protein